MDDARKILAVTLADGSVVEHTMSDGEVTVGRSRTNRIMLEDTTVSRHHAKFITEAGRILLEDLGSSVGTWLNTVRLPHNTLHEVHTGDEIRFGRLLARLMGQEDASEAPTSFMDLASLTASLRGKTAPPPPEAPPSESDDSIRLPELGKRFSYKPPEATVAAILAAPRPQPRTCPRCGRPLPPFMNLCQACTPAPSPPPPLPPVSYAPSPSPMMQQPDERGGLNPHRPIAGAEQDTLLASPHSLKPAAHTVATSLGTRTKPVLTLAAPGSDLFSPQLPSPPEDASAATATGPSTRSISPLVLIILLLLLLAFGLAFLWWKSAR